MREYLSNVENGKEWKKNIPGFVPWARAPFRHGWIVCAGRAARRPRPPGLSYLKRIESIISKYQRRRTSTAYSSLTLLLHHILGAPQFVLQLAQFVAQFVARRRNRVHLIAQYLNLTGQLVNLDDQIVLNDVECVSVSLKKGSIFEHGRFGLGALFIEYTWWPVARCSP